MKQLAENVTLSAAEGEAMIARLSVYAPSRSDCEMLSQVVRWYFWLAAAIKEAKLSLKKLRTLLCGQGPKPSTRCEPAASSVSASSRGDGEVSGDGSARDEEGGRSTEAGSKPESVASAAETSKPRGGHRPGTGRAGVWDDHDRPPLPDFDFTRRLADRFHAPGCSHPRRDRSSQCHFSEAQPWRRSAARRWRKRLLG